MKMANLPKPIYSFSKIPIKIPSALHIEKKKNPKIHMDAQNIPVSESNAEPNRIIPEAWPPVG